MFHRQQPPRRSTQIAVTGLLLLSLLGCQNAGGPQGSKEGSEEAARAFVKSEFDKWMGDQECQVRKQQVELFDYLPPVAYEIKSMIPDKPDPLAFKNGIPDGYTECPAYRVNVDIEFKSRTGGSVHKVATYNVTWNKQDKVWGISGRL